MNEGLDLFQSTALMVSKMPEDLFTEPDDDWEPMLLMETEDEEMGMAPLGPLMTDEMHKDVLANYVLPEAIRAFRPRVIIMVMSTWTSLIASEHMGTDKHIPPSKQPDRSERLLLLEFTREGIGRQGWAQIVRHEDKPPTLGEWDDFPADAFGGRFVDPILAAMKALGPHEQ